MTVGSLFAGIGGFDLGLERAGMRVLWQVEIDDWKRDTVLAYHWPDVARFRDVRKCGNPNLAEVNVICGGTPCQDFSTIGGVTASGLKGKKSILIAEMARICQELMPDWVIIENVENLWIWINEILKLFPHWSLYAKSLSADAFGAYTRRKRVFIVGHLRSRGGRSIFDKASYPGAAFQTGGARDSLPMCLPWNGGTSIERLGSCVVENPKTYTIRVRKSDGVSRRMDRCRWDAIGNAVAVPVTEWIGRRIVEIEAELMDDR